MVKASIFLDVNINFTYIYRAKEIFCVIYDKIRFTFFYESNLCEKFKLSKKVVLFFDKSVSMYVA